VKSIQIYVIKFVSNSRQIAGKYQEWIMIIMSIYIKWHIFPIPHWYISSIKNGS